MEELFMQVFERRDWVAAQMRQQVDSHAQSLACTLVAAGHRPPPWLLPSCAGEPQDLNGNPIVSELVFPGSQITTPATNRTVFHPPAATSTFFRKVGIPNGYNHQETICAALDTNQHEEPQQKQTSVNQELAEVSAEVNMFSRIQRSRSRQRNIEDRLRGKDQVADSGSSDGIQDRMQRSSLATIGLNRATALLSSKPCGDSANNAGTTSSLPGQENGFYTNQGRSTEFLKCSKDDDHGNQGVHLDCSQSLVLENQIVSSENNVKVPNNCSNLLRAQVADSVCHPLPETHLLVEPKKLQFDGVESVCMNPASEQTMRQPKFALESAHLDLAGAHPLNEDPSSTSCSQVPCSMGRSLLDDGDVESRYLILVKPVKQHRKYALECASLGLTGMHSRNEDPSLSSPSEVPKSMSGPLLEKDTRHISEANSLEGPCSKVSPPLENENLSSVETNCFKRSCSGVNPLLGRDTQNTVEDIERIRKLDGFSNRTVTRNSKSLEQQCSDYHLLHPPYSGSLQLPSQLADTRSGAPASSGMLPDSLLEEDGCDNPSHSLINDANSQCSQDRSAACPEQLPPQTVSSGYVYQPNLSSYKTESNDTHSNGCPVMNASVSAENELSREQYLLSRPSLEFNGNFADADTPLGHPPLGTENLALNGKPASDAVNCHSGNLGDVQVKFSALTEACDVSVRNRKNQSAVPEVTSIISARRTSAMHTIERNSMTSAEKCTENLQQDGTEQEASLFENAVQINANSCTTENNKCIKSSEKINLLHSDGSRAASDQKRSVAHGVQVTGGLSSKRRRITCQSDIALSRSRRTNSLSLNHEVGISGQMLAVANFSEKSQPSGRYFLRSSGSCGLMFLKSEGRNAASKGKMPFASDVHENGNSSPARRKRTSLSDVVPHNSPRASSSRNEIVGKVFENSKAQSQNNLEVEFVTTAPLPSCSGILSCNDEHCTQEENPSLEGEDLNVTNMSVADLNVTNMSVADKQMALHMNDMSSWSIILDPEKFSGTNSFTIFPSNALDQHGEQTSVPNALFPEKLNYGSNVELDMKCRSYDSKECLLSGAAIPRQEGDESVNCDDTMPEFESFDVPVQFDSPTIGERTFEALCDSRQLVTFSSDLPKKYNINTAGGVHQLFGTISGKPTDCSFPDDLCQYSASNDSSTTDIFRACELGHDGSFFISEAAASCSSNASNRQENIENPLTPSVEKYSLGKLSARAGSGSEHMGSIPELECFRIDEDSSIADENEYQDRLPGSGDTNYSHQCPSGRIALQDITGLCQNTGNSTTLSTRLMDTGKIDLTAETCSSELNHHSNITNDHDSKKPKENRATSVKRGGKVSHSLHDGLSRTEILDYRNERHMSEANLYKRSKPSNVVANVTSFIPLVKPKLQPKTAFVKKDVRVKALEAAEAAKRLEEKKRSEREMRKAAAKLERERLKQEKELKQKQEEEQKKKQDADVATRKRQREEEERREKERKRKCIDEARKQQKQPMDRRHAVNNEKDARRKASDNKELRKNLVDAGKSQVKPDETTEPALGYKANKSNNENGVAVDERPASFGSHAKESIPNSLEESYKMSPYKDSDEEDDDDFEHEQESKRRRKLIPSWARKENLDKILLSNQTLDPREIFAQKCSFNLSDVLSVHNLQRAFR